MSIPPALDPQAAAAVSTINGLVAGVSVAMASASQQMTLGHAQALAAYNAVFAQQQAYITAQSASVAGLIALLRR